jgi:hypothetical protein
VFLEHRFALELRSLGLIELIIPVMVGDTADGVSYGPYLPDCAPLCSESHVRAVEQDVVKALEMQALGSPLSSNRTVRSVYEEIMQQNGELRTRGVMIAQMIECALNGLVGRWTYHFCMQLCST